MLPDGLSLICQFVAFVGWFDQAAFEYLAAELFVTIVSYCVIAQVPIVCRGVLSRHPQTLTPQVRNVRGAFHQAHAGSR